MDPLVVKFIEVLIMQVMVVGAIVAILVAAVWDIVQAKVRESRRKDHLLPPRATHRSSKHAHRPAPSARASH